MAKKNQGTSVGKRCRERDKMFKRREKEERRCLRKEEKARGEGARVIEVRGNRVVVAKIESERES